MPPFAGAGVHIELEERVPVAFRNVGACQRFDFDAIRQSVLALAPDHLALARGEIVQERVEIRVAPVEEMELLIGPLEKTGGAKRIPVGLCRKRDMDRGRPGFVPQGAQAGDQRLPRRLAMPRRNQQPPAGDGRERHGDLKLRVIVEAGALIGVGPAMVEDIFAH